MADFFLDLCPFGFEIHILEVGAGALGQRGAALENLLLQGWRKPAGRLAQIAGEKADH
jgi:hypothetical protein